MNNKNNHKDNAQTNNNNNNNDRKKKNDSNQNQVATQDATGRKERHIMKTRNKKRTSMHSTRLRYKHSRIYRPQKRRKSDKWPSCQGNNASCCTAPSSKWSGRDKSQQIREEQGEELGEVRWGGGPSNLTLQNNNRKTTTNNQKTTETKTSQKMQHWRKLRWSYRPWNLTWRLNKAKHKQKEERVRWGGPFGPDLTRNLPKHKQEP